MATRITADLTCDNCGQHAAVHGVSELSKPIVPGWTKLVVFDLCPACSDQAFRGEDLPVLEGKISETQREVNKLLDEFEGYMDHIIPRSRT